MSTVGSLFAGVGGFDLGMEQAGFKVLWQAEWDKHCQSVLRRHWPDCTLYGDVTDVNGAEIAPVDVITFGSPCQDLSVAGKRAGLDGDRSSMLFQAIRIIKEMQDATAGTFPRIAIWENVPGALSSNRGADFGIVLDSLANVGALAIEWAVLDAQHFGVPQRRRRVFVVAVFDPVIGERCPDPLLPVAEGRRRNSAKSRKKGQNPAGHSEDGSTNGRGYRMLGFGHCDDDDCASALKQRDHKDATDLAVIPFVKSRRAKSTTDHETWMEGDVAPTLNAFDNATETRATVVMPTFIFDSGSHGAPRESKDVVPTLTGRMGTGGNNTPLAAQPSVYDGYNFGSNANVFTDLSPTLKATQASPSVATEYAVRRLTPLECERLMGWPDDHTRWTDDGREQADSHRYRQCGNGVASPVAAWIGSHLLPLLEANDEQ